MRRFARRPFRSFRRRLYARSKSYRSGTFSRGRAVPLMRFTRPMQAMVRGPAGSLTNPVRAGYGGLKEFNYQTGTFRFQSRIIWTGAYANIDKIQFVIWSAARFRAMVSASPSLKALADSHDQYRLVYSGVKVTPLCNINGPSTAIQGGSIYLMPVTSDSTYKFAALATGGTPFYRPEYVTNLKEVVAGSREQLFSGTQSNPRPLSLYQKGFSYQEAYEQPIWNAQVGFNNTFMETTLKASDWRSTYTSSTGSPSLYSNTQYWGPCAVWSNWNAAETLPYAFVMETTYKFAFKGRRLNVESGQTEEKLSEPIIRIPTVTGLDIDQNENVVDDLPPIEEEAKLMESQDVQVGSPVSIDEVDEKASEPMGPPAPVLKRVLTNVGLPPPPKQAKKVIA